jgi:DNA-directed RNA polymerase subunit RPC12/RpoP
MFTNSIEAVCKRCGKKAPVEQFVLDKDYKMVVCPICVKEKKLKEEAKINEEAKIVEVTDKPAGWDKDDEYLEKAHNLREKMRPQFEKMDSERIRYICQKCRYKFVYNILKESPHMCPYCGTAVSGIKSAF